MYTLPTQDVDTGDSLRILPVEQRNLWDAIFGNQEPPFVPPFGQPQPQPNVQPAPDNINGGVGSDNLYGGSGSDRLNLSGPVVPSSSYTGAPNYFVNPSQVFGNPGSIAPGPNNAAALSPLNPAGIGNNQNNQNLPVTTNDRLTNSAPETNRLPYLPYNPASPVVPTVPTPGQEFATRGGGAILGNTGTGIGFTGTGSETPNPAGNGPFLEQGAGTVSAGVNGTVTVPLGDNAQITGRLGANATGSYAPGQPAATGVPNLGGSVTGTFSTGELPSTGVGVNATGTGRVGFTTPIGNSAAPSTTYGNLQGEVNVGNQNFSVGPYGQIGSTNYHLDGGGQTVNTGTLGLNIRAGDVQVQPYVSATNYPEPSSTIGVNFRTDLGPGGQTYVPTVQTMPPVQPAPFVQPAPPVQPAPFVQPVNNIQTFPGNPGNFGIAPAPVPMTQPAPVYTPPVYTPPPAPVYTPPVYTAPVYTAPPVVDSFDHRYNFDISAGAARYDSDPITGSFNDSFNDSSARYNSDPITNSFNSSFSDPITDSFNSSFSDPLTDSFNSSFDSFDSSPALGSSDF